jgi:hypothetical protein
MFLATKFKKITIKGLIILHLIPTINLTGFTGWFGLLIFGFPDESQKNPVNPV